MPGVSEQLNIRRIKSYHTPNVVNLSQNNNTMTAQHTEPEETRPQHTGQNYNSQTRGLTYGIRDGSYFHT